MIKRLLIQFGIDPGRVRLEWISASEGARFARSIQEFTDTVTELGPVRMGRNIPAEGESNIESGKQ
jgi:coenzyme F420-reducing hydrogenase delta subunit